MKPAHHHRPAGTAPKPAAQAAQATGYPEGHFTALVNRHAWPPQFVSQIAPEPRRQPVQQQVGGGFQRSPLGLKGAVEHVERWQEKKARAA